MSIRMIVLAVLVVSVGMIALASAQQPDTEMNTQIIGYYAPYGIYVTAPLNQSVSMIDNFTIILRSPGESTYQVTANGKPYSNGSFEYLAALWFNTSWSGNYLVSISIYSSTLNVNQTFVYKLNMMNYVQYVSYVSSHIQPQRGTYTLTQILEAVGAGIIGMAIMIPVFERLFFGEGVRQRSKEGGVRTG
jgi:hypothetical protein